MTDALTLAASKGHDVFNALELGDNPSFLKDLKFGPGDGTLNYYLYNWRLSAAPLPAAALGLILL
jgi:glycylpeptide N-tetradecanoyltransferase